MEAQELVETETRTKRPYNRNLQVRERRMLLEMMEGKTQTAAYRDAGYSPNGAKVAASKKMKQPTFREAFIERLKEAGLDDAGIAAKLREGVESMQYGMTKDGTVVVLGPDNHARAKFVDMAIKASGGYPDPRAGLNIEGSRVVILQNSDAQLGSVGLFGAEVIDSPDVRLLPDGQAEGE